MSGKAALLLAVLACMGNVDPYDLALPPSNHVQPFRGVYLVAGHLEWWRDPFSRTDDNETYPKIVILSASGHACVLTSDDKGYGEWASLIRDDPVNCPRSWRTARLRD